VALGGGFGRGQRLAGAAEGLGTAAVVLLLVGVLIYAATRPTLRVRVDLTEGARYTLSAQTRDILANLEKPVTFIQLMRPEMQLVPNGLADVQQRAIDYVANLLKQYVIASNGMVSFRRLDPNVDRIEAQQLVMDLHLTGYDVVIAQGSGRTRLLHLSELVTIDRGLADPQSIAPAQLVDLRAEGPLTSALLEVGSERQPRVGLLRRFGGPDPSDYGEFGLGRFADALRGQGLQAFDLDLQDATAVPDGTDAVIVWGPQVPLGPRVSGMLAAFQAGGGGLVIGLDPLVADADADNLLAGLGAARDHAVIARDDVPFEGVRRSLLALNDFARGHPISAPIARQGIFATFLAAGALARTPQARSNLLATPLLTTPESVFADKPAGPGQPGDYTLGEGEERSRRVVALALEPPAGGKSVIFGSSSFLTNTFLTSAEGGPANMDLGLNSVNWVLGRKSAIEARPREVIESRVDMTPDERRTVSLYVLGLMPLGGALLGVLVWFARRR